MLHLDGDRRGSRLWCPSFCTWDVVSRAERCDETYARGRANLDAHEATRRNVGSAVSGACLMSIVLIQASHSGNAESTALKR